MNPGHPYLTEKYFAELLERLGPHPITRIETTTNHYNNTFTITIISERSRPRPREFRSRPVTTKKETQRD